MLDVARPEARARVRSHPTRLSWGIVDAILALLMLPFGIWLIVIEGLVNGVTWLLDGRWTDRHSARSGQN
jgi:hypothetical protein